MKKNSLMKSGTLLIFLLLTSISAMSEVIPGGNVEVPELPIPFPICDPERLMLDPDPTSWRIGIIKITPEMREQILRYLSEGPGPEPQPWMESEYCAVIY